MRLTLIASILLSSFVCEVAAAAEAKVVFTGEKKLNNLVSELLVVSSISKPGGSFSFRRSSDGWIFISATHKGRGTASIILDDAPPSGAIIVQGANGVAEGMRLVAKGEHKLKVNCESDISIDQLVVKAIPELIHCGLYNPAIKSYGPYDMEFLKKDVLPNITGLISLRKNGLSQAAIDDWHRQDKKFILQTWVSNQAKTGEDHFKNWTDSLESTPFADGIIIDEFIINNPMSRPNTPISPERQARLDKEHQVHKIYEDALRQIRADARYKDKMVYAYIGGSGKKLNQEVVGPTFVHTLIECKIPIALERYLFERSSEQGTSCERL